MKRSIKGIPFLKITKNLGRGKLQIIAQIDIISALKLRYSVYVNVNVNLSRATNVCACNSARPLYLDPNMLVVTGF